MPELIVTRHAMDRYRERVKDVPDRDIFAHLTSATFALAADFGARYVRFPKGQRAVIVDHRIVTVLPSEHPAGRLDPARDCLFDDGDSAANPAPAPNSNSTGAKGGRHA